MQLESPKINGDGNYSRDFTYIDNVIQMNLLAMTTTDVAAINTVYNTACGDRITLNEMVTLLKDYLSEYDAAIAAVPVVHGPSRAGDIPHSMASIEKATRLLNYKPTHTFAAGLKEAVHWYWAHLK